MRARSTFRKTVTEADVGLFAGITGDFAPQPSSDAAGGQALGAGLNDEPVLSLVPVVFGSARP